jgi:hypothetical protein
LKTLVQEIKEEAIAVGVILCGIISGHAKDTFGSYAVAFYPTAALAAAGIVIAFLLLKPPKYTGS